MVLKRHPHPRKRAREVRVAPITLSDEHRAWVVENALRGLEPASLIDTLSAAGVPPRIARSEVTAILTSPAMPGVIQLHRRAERLELLARLLRTVSGQAERPGEVERRETIGAEELYDRYYSASRPVVLTRLLAGLRALGRWTPEHFAEHYGDADVEVVTGREADPDCDRNFAAHRATMKLAAYVKMVRSAGTTNDFYMIAHNRALEQPGLAALLDDLDPPSDIFDPAIVARGASLWFGPAGTVTRLHHDSTNIMVCQIYGKKRIDLISPLETALLAQADGFYSRARVAELGAAGLADVKVLSVELSAGEALFLPAGWWHEVSALEVSIHVSLMAFRRPNDLSFYAPGGV